MRYMTVKDILDYVDEIKQNSFSRKTKLIWLNELEYRVQTDVMLLAAERITYIPDDDTHTLLVPAPWSEIYYDYILMKLSEHLEESSEQNNRAATFDKAFTRFMRWWADTYRPANGNALFKGYYLKGEKGEDGAFRVNVTYSDGVYSADKTFDEIKAAYNAGQQPYVVQTSGASDIVYTLAGSYLPSGGAGQEFVSFERYLIFGDTLETVRLRIFSYTLENGSNIELQVSPYDGLSKLSEEKVSLPKDTDGNVIPGTAGWYAVSDGAGGITWVESAPSTGGGGETTTHGIVWDLVNVTSSNNAVSVADGASLVAVLTPADGYTLGDVTITMGGEVVTGAWNADTATVTIQSVTGDVVISCAGVVAATEEVIAHTWSNGVWKYDTTTETWGVDTGTMARCCIQQQIDATDGYLKIRFNRQNSYDQYMSDPATDCPMIEPMVANGIMNLATTKLNNLGNAALVEMADTTWQKLEWDTDYYLPAGYIYRIQLARNVNQTYVLDEDSLAYTAYSETVRLGSSNANLKSIVTTDGFCTITKITGGSISTEASVASSVDAQYTQELGISTTSLVPNDVESEPTTYTGAIKKAISEWMIAYKGDTRKVPVIIHTDQHGRLSSASKPIFTALGNLVPWYDVSKIINLGDCVGDHWEDADTANPFLACSDLEAMMECLAGIPISKRLDVFGNHDTWYHDANGNDVVVPDQARLSQYFRNIFARNPNSNQQGYFVDYDNKYNVKYVVVSGFEYTTSRSTFRISTAQMKWLIGEMSKDDGYDIVVVSHVPLHYATENMTFPTGYEATGTENYRVSNVDTDALFAARKNKVSGTVTDSDGVEHHYDFSSCTTEVLCALHGHTHHDAYNYVGTAGLLSVSFDWFADNTMHFVLVDRVNRRLNVWKVDSTNTVQNYQVPLDNATK